MNRFKKVKNSAVYFFVILFFKLFNILPRDLAQFCGELIGYTAYLLSTKDRLKAMRHLKMIYGDNLSYSERQVIVRNLYRNFGRNIIDFIRIKKYFKSELLPLIQTEGLEHFDKVYGRGRGVIGITGHIGNFELLAVYFAYKGYKAAVIGREMYDRRLDKILVENRQAMGIENIDTEDSPRKVLRMLKSGAVLGVLIDTDSMRVRSELIPAFGRLSNTPVGQTILGLKTGAGFVPVACVRFGRGYKIIVKPEIRFERSNNFEKDVYNITKRCTGALEEIINEYRDQWIWIHNRWLTRPE
jgi:Kdo2-lipid IVA lauroyltransferase/acyltransferase